MINQNTKVGLIQIRVNEDVLAEESSSFFKATGLSAEQFVIVNPIKEKLGLESLENVDAFLIGGSGAYSVTKDYEWTDNLLSFVASIIERDIPCFGSCWGHQFLARLLGGKVIHDEGRSEMGTHEVKLTSFGKEDTLLSTLPDVFLAQMGHQDLVSVLPPHCIELAYSKIAPNQAFKLKNKAVYGSQFHPELSAENEIGRLEAYRDAYPNMAEPETFQAVVGAVCDTPEVSKLLRSFLEQAKAGMLV